MKEQEAKIEIGDSVRIKAGDLTVYTVVGIGPSTSFKLQQGRDAASWQQIDGSKLVIVRKAQKAEAEPGFVPDRSINDVGY
jgi:hypothetical protein